MFSVSLLPCYSTACPLTFLFEDACTLRDWILFVWVEALHPSQQFFSHVGMFTWIKPVLSNCVSSTVLSMLSGLEGGKCGLLKATTNGDTARSRTVVHDANHCASPPPKQLR